MKQTTTHILRRTARVAIGAPALALALALAASSVAAQGFPEGHEGAFGPLFQPAPHNRVGHSHHPKPGPVRRWNQIAVDASGLDHSPLAPGEVRVFGEQLGPGRSSRAMAIVHIAMFDAVNAIVGGYRGYTGIRPAPPRTSLVAAVSSAAHDALSALYPSQKARFDAFLADDLRRIADRRERNNGTQIGRRAAAAILALRAADGSQYAEPMMGVEHITSDLPGRWRQDPISMIPIALGAHWGEVAPFAVESSSQFRAPPPPALESAEYAAAFDDAKRLGGDGIDTPTERDEEQSLIGTYWAYDGTPSLCAPPRLYNQIANEIADTMGTGDTKRARLLALVNVAMADAGTTIWESKYYYDLWRPVTGIREADEGSGPTGLGDGNPATVGDPEFRPLGAPASNLSGPDFTPPFPAYPSGHAGFGGALFQVLRRYYGTDDIPFTFVSDEFNGVTQTSDGAVRPLVPRSFSSLSEAEEENGRSRIYLGIHWDFDKTEGIAQGRRVGNYVFNHTLRPLRRER